MKSLILYSSLTGNTKQLAEAIAQALPHPSIYPINKAPDVLDAADFDIIALGYWVIRGMPDPRSLAYLKKIKQGSILLFGTLGAYPDSSHAQKCIAQSEALLRAQSAQINLLGTFLCMGRVNPAQLAKSKHPMTPQRKARLEEGSHHPNEADFAAAKDFVHDRLNNFRESPTL